MRRICLCLLIACLAFSWWPKAALAADTDAPIRPQLVASQLRGAEESMAAARAESARLRAEMASADQLGQLRLDLLAQLADYRYRAAVRTEQVLVYRLAGDPALAAAVMPLLPTTLRVGTGRVMSALQSLWTLAGIDDFSQVRIGRGHTYGAPTSVADLTSFYQQAAQRYGLDWTYLAAINYIESDFGRNTNTSTAGAQGPMQFLPSTWAQYGAGGNILDAHDAIFAAALYLYRNGAPQNMDLALFRYNNDTDYVDSVQSFAAAIRLDPLWLDRMFYWGTTG